MNSDRDLNIKNCMRSDECVAAYMWELFVADSYCIYCIAWGYLVTLCLFQCMEYASWEKVQIVYLEKMLFLWNHPMIGKYFIPKPKKINVVFPLTRPTLFYCPDLTDYIGKLVDTELKGRYKTVTPLSRDCKSACHWTLLMRSYEKGN